MENVELFNQRYLHTNMATLKQICDLAELKKALLAANVLQYIDILSGEQQAQSDGSMLPVAQLSFSDFLAPDVVASINSVFIAQGQRDWKAFASSCDAVQQTVDSAMKTDAQIAQIKAMDDATYNAFWNGLTANQKDVVLKKLLRYLCLKVF